jgi:DNA-binding Lrp family transcriptional regulator
MEKNPDILLKNIPSELSANGTLDQEIPYPTLQRRVNRMIEQGIIAKHFFVNWAQAGYLVRYRVGILIDPVELRKTKAVEGSYNTQNGLADYIINSLAKSEPFRNQLVIDDVYILLGGNVDLAVDFYAKDDKTATQFIIHGLRDLAGVRDTTSAKLAYSTKFGWLGRDATEMGS